MGDTGKTVNDRTNVQEVRKEIMTAEQAARNFELVDVHEMLT